ncbi:MAG: hypothetical protein HYY18_16315 [Planctomycetes bacterium]|nr:hypothetical protein [Planctomycetota bacterium]
MKALIAFLLAAAAAAADPSFAERLASDDPAVRAGAQRELDALPAESADDIEEMAGGVADPEAKAALLAAAQRLRNRSLVERADALARRIADGKADQLAEIAALDAEALPVLVRWLESDLEIGNPFFSGSCWVDFTMIPLRRAARVWLQLLTGESTGEDPADWAAFSAARKGRALADVVREGLLRRGYAVAAEDPNVAAAEHVRAFVTESAKGWPSPTNDWEVRSMSLSARWLMETALGESARSGDLFAPHPAEAAPFAQWVAANRGCVTWDGRRFGSKAGKDHYLLVLKRNDDAALQGALRALRPWAAEVIEDVRPFAAAFPWEVAALFGAAGTPATAAEARAFLAGLADSWNRPEFRPVFTGDALVELLAGERDQEILTRALHALSIVGEPRHADAALRFADREHHPSGSTGSWRAARAAQAVATLGDDAQIARILHFLDYENRFIRLEVGLALARRGRAEGLRGIGDACEVGYVNGPAAAEALRAVFEYVPESTDAAAWKEWGKGLSRYRWDAAAGKWRR